MSTSAININFESENGEINVNIENGGWGGGVFRTILCVCIWNTTGAMQNLTHRQTLTLSPEQNLGD